MAAVRDYGRPRVDDPARLDGVARGRGGRDRVHRRDRHHPTGFVTGIVDLTRRRGGVARLLDVVEGAPRRR